MPDFAVQWSGGAGVELVENMYDALLGADAVFLMTEWKMFWSPDYELMKQKMHTPVIFDGRNIYDQNVLKAHGFRYFGVGRGARV